MKESSAALFYTALGGAVGAVARHFLSGLDSAIFPWGVLCCNVLGAGLLAVHAKVRHHYSTERWHFHGVGFCGGFTTVSSFSGQIVRYLEAGDVSRGLLYALVSVSLAFPLAWWITSFERRKGAR
jgi:CrcB protein